MDYNITIDYNDKEKLYYVTWLYDLEFDLNDEDFDVTESYGKMVFTTKNISDIIVILEE